MSGTKFHVVGEILCQRQNFLPVPKFCVGDNSGQGVNFELGAKSWVWAKISCQGVNFMSRGEFCVVGEILGRGWIHFGNESIQCKKNIQNYRIGGVRSIRSRRRRTGKTVVHSVPYTLGFQVPECNQQLVKYLLITPFFKQLHKHLVKKIVEQ